MRGTETVVSRRECLVRQPRRQCFVDHRGLVRPQRSSRDAAQPYFVSRISSRLFCAWCETHLVGATCRAPSLLCGGIAGTLDCVCSTPPTLVNTHVLAQQWSANINSSFHFLSRVGSVSIYTIVSYGLLFFRVIIFAPPSPPSLNFRGPEWLKRLLFEHSK